jgi:hypothetical protein
VKIVAYSKIPSHTPFVHLAYLSATTTKPSTSLLVGGMALLVVGAYVLGQMGLPFGKWREPLARPPRARKWPLHLLGATVLLAGIVIVVLAYVYGQEVDYDTRPMPKKAISLDAAAPDGNNWKVYPMPVTSH